MYGIWSCASAAGCQWDEPHAISEGTKLWTPEQLICFSAGAVIPMPRAVSCGNLTFERSMVRFALYVGHCHWWHCQWQAVPLPVAVTACVWPRYDSSD